MRNTVEADQATTMQKEDEENLEEEDERDPLDEKIDKNLAEQAWWWSKK